MNSALHETKILEERKEEATEETMTAAAHAGGMTFGCFTDKEYKSRIPSSNKLVFESFRNTNLLLQSIILQSIG